MPSTGLKELPAKSIKTFVRAGYDHIHHTEASLLVPVPWAGSPVSTEA